MRKVEHIEEQTRELSSAEFAELRDWVLERDWANWDAQIEADAAAGKLDKLLVEARADFYRGETRTHAADAESRRSATGLCPARRMRASMRET